MWTPSVACSGCGNRFGSLKRPEIQQGCGRDPQPLGDQEDVLKADIPFPSLHTAVIAAIQVDARGEGFLGNPLLSPELPNATAEKDFHIRGWHPVTVVVCLFSIHGLYTHGL